MSELPVETPELNRQKEIIDSGQAKAVQEFLDWLRQEKGYVLARYEKVDGYREEQLFDVYPDPERLMADHFGIDLNKIESERRALLDALRSDHR